jgi:hypothetical protein
LEELRKDYATLPVILVSNIERQHNLSHDKFIWFMEKPRLPQHIVTAVENTIQQFSI